MKKTILLMALVLVLGANKLEAALPDYDVTEFGPGSYIYAKSLNNKNEVVGYIKPNDSWSGAYAFYWNKESGLQSIGGYRANSINDLSQIAGQSAFIQAGVWENGEWITLSNRQEAYAINNSGQVTGLISAQPSIPGPYAPFRDDDIYSPSFITLQRPYSRASYGFDINNKGQVVADCGTGISGTLYVGIFYDSDTSYTILDNDGNYDAHARGINDYSQIVGYSMVGPGSDHLAVFWDSPTSYMQYMGSLGEGSSVAYAINNLGQAVGFSADRAFLWNKDEGMVDLNMLIEPELSITLTGAFDISDEGSIVTWGIDSLGQKGSYLLTILEQAIKVAVDIKPGSCPNPLNVKSKGVLPVAILGSADLDVTTIVISSIRLAGVAPIRDSYEDVAGGLAGADNCDCTESGPDGFDDLTLKFETQEIVEAIGEVDHGDIRELSLTGVLHDPSSYETPIEGADCVMIKGKHKPANKADINKDGVVNPIDFAIITENWLEGTEP